MTDCTIAICTRNRAGFLLKCLNALTEINLTKGHRVIVVDNGSTDETKSIVEKFTCVVEYAFAEEVGLSNARNVAISKCNTEYLVFLDDDGIPDSTWLTGISEAIKNDPDVFGGPFRPYYTIAPPSWFLDEFGSAHLDLVDGAQDFGVCFSGGNMGWRKSLLIEFGKFDPALGMVGDKLALGEETAIQMRIWNEKLKPKFWFSEMMSMTHHSPPEKMKLSYIWKRNFIYGRSLRSINERDPMLDLSVTDFILQSKLGLPLVQKLLFQKSRGGVGFRTYAARYLIINAMRIGILFDKLMRMEKPRTRGPAHDHGGQG